ncbi:hypothetical protein N4P33_33230 [Streptomyces sp. 15-116A]|uniref:hypothetical protein n=1 Tax=Streptomyces sp. 15-116A TaxID=2259035 RepID=UPI0021B473D3|nr:hypothetical protein [Streptomyces sp. 15-116A]MCT7356968.1 hypothetical protein [Streptomyces sp. 15-116A]
MHAIRVASAALLGAGALTLTAAPVAGAETAAGAPPAAVSAVSAASARWTASAASAASGASVASGVTGATEVRGVTGLRAEGGIVTPSRYSVEPAIVEPGDTVTLRVDRSDGACTGHVTVTSALFDTVTIPPRRSTAMTTIDRDARVGARYRVSFTCVTFTETRSLTIGGPVSLPTPVDVEPGENGHGRHPKGVHAGEGGAFAGAGLGTMGLGAVLVAGSLGVAYRLYRRPGEQDGS